MVLSPIPFKFNHRHCVSGNLRFPLGILIKPEQSSRGLVTKIFHSIEPVDNNGRTEQSENGNMWIGYYLPNSFVLTQMDMRMKQ